MDLGPNTITHPLLSTVYRAPLGEVAPLDFTLFLAGPTGAQKTELTVLAQANYGAGFNGKCLPGNWATTANGLEKQAFLVKDAIFTVDDFAPSGTTADVQRLHRDADRLIRGQGNRAGRGRLRPDGSLRPEYYPRGIVVSSGEDIPRGQSLRARALILEISQGQIDLAQLTSAQHAAAQGQLAAAMAGYVQWLAPQIDTLKRTMPERLRELRAAARKEPVHHDRTPDIVASLAVGWGMFLRFACEAGAIDDGQRISLWQQGWQTLLEAAEAQAGYQTDEEPTARVLALLGSAITSGQAHVADAETGGQPEDAGNWGWRRRAYLSGQVEQEEWQPKGALVGWLDGDDLLLDPEAAYAAVQRLARDQGSGVLIGAKTLWKRMAEQGKLGSKDGSRTRNTVRRIIHGRRRYVIHVFADGPLSPRTGPIGPIGPDPSVSAGSGAENVGRLFGDGEKSAHENGPKPQENRDAGPIGPIGPIIEQKLRPSDESLTEVSGEGSETPAPAPAPTTGKWQERI